MGWLKDRMEDLKPRVTSMSALAERVCEARAWPRSEKLKPNSLATYLGRLDEGEELSRLEERPFMLKALAEVLGMTAEDMEEQLVRLRAPKPQADFRFKLRDVPLRPIDLSREPPPPGLPDEVLSPDHWPLWWHAPTGSGRTLAGQWVAARGLATFIQAATWAEAERQLPKRGAVFLELGSAEGAPIHVDPVAGLKLCVASEAHPPEPPPRAPSETQLLARAWPLAELQPQAEPEPQTKLTQPAVIPWPLVENPRVSTWLGPLMAWLEERATGDGLDTKSCLDWLESLTGTSGILSEEDTLDTALGLIGLFATYTRKEGAPGPLKKAQSLADLARLLLRMRRQQFEEVDLKADVLWDRLRGMSKRLLLEAEEPWFEARPLDDWQALAVSQPDGGDLDWLGALAPHGLKVDPAALAKAREKLPPEAFRTVRALRALGLLREKQPRQFALSPLWVLQGMLEQALQELVTGEAPAVWGKVLLQQEWADSAVQHLLERGRRGDFTAMRALMGSPEPSSPAWVAAFEASFRVLGLVSLEGVELPDELRLGMLRLQRKLLVPTHDGAPQPRLTHDNPYAREEYLLDASSWYAALLALVEPVPTSEDVSFESWCRGLSPDNVRWLFFMATSFRTEERKHQLEPWKLPLLLLGGRLLDRLPPPSSPLPRPPDVLQPERLLRLLQQDTPSLKEIDESVYWDELADALPDYARARGLDWKQLARKIWNLWLTTDGAELPQCLWPQQEHAEVFWRALPAEALSVLIRKRRWMLQKEEKVFSFFDTSHWDAFVDVWIELASQRQSTWRSDPPRFAWASIPPGHVRRALRAGLPDPYDHDTRRALWQRMPDVLCEEIEALFKKGLWDWALTQAWGVPPAYFPRVLSSAEAAVAQAGLPPPPSALARWLREEVGRRVPDWQRAWALLERLLPTTKPG
ncbi:hypothetical protein [Pyxidicoccus trucidator]|uniref:hypothetical protein n=1 Tax=Pyxidicoccus trucidator TaxID=2709662 RepID=UPI0013DABF3A|nr:hypothetical protein [Pyxidicoccus trucidator]